MFTVQSITAYKDQDFFTDVRASTEAIQMPLEEMYLKASQVDTHPDDPGSWSPQGLALGVARAPRKSLFLFYLAAHEFETGQFNESFLHTIQGLMAMDDIPALPEKVYAVFRFVFLVFEILCEEPFKQEIGCNLIEGMRKIPVFGLPSYGEESIVKASVYVAKQMEEEFEFIPRSAKYLRDKLLNSETQHNEL